MQRKWIGAIVLLVGAGAAAATWAVRRTTNQAPETNIPARTRATDDPTAAEDALLGRAETANWPVTDPRTEFGVRDGRAYAMVCTEHGVAKLVTTDDDTTFRLVSYYSSRGHQSHDESTLPEEITVGGLHYDTFLGLVDERHLDDPDNQS